MVLYKYYCKHDMKHYISFFTEISEFYVNSTDTEEMALSKFYTEKDIIQNLDLTPFSAKINSSQMPSIQASILKVLLS